MSICRQLYQQVPEPVRRIRHDFRRWIAGWCELLSDGFYDTQRFAKHSLSVRGKFNQDNKRAKLIFLYHKIEKAMALPEPRPGFGRNWISVDFIPLLIDYSENYGCDELVQTCCVNLESYVRFNKALGVEMQEIYDLIKNTLDRIQRPISEIGGGVVAVTASSIHSAASIDFSYFALNRHSIRNFTSDEVDHATIEAAILIAQRTPSVCNRQAWHVYAFDKKESILHALKYQSGNDGFNNKVKILLMVTGDLSAMMASFERNQIWVDGGMFSMSLVYALHSLKLGTCCLNLCHNAKGDRMLRQALKIAPNHTPVMMIAVGHIPTTLHVAHSLRRGVKEVLIWN